MEIEKLKAKNRQANIAIVVIVLTAAAIITALSVWLVDTKKEIEAYDETIDMACQYSGAQETACRAGFDMIRKGMKK